MKTLFNLNLDINQNAEVLFKIIPISSVEWKKTWTDWKIRFDVYRAKTLMFDHVDPQGIEQYATVLRTAFHRDN
jgi:hypothetical protein